AVMLMPVKPKEADFDPATDANWRTVLVGALEEGGIKTSLTYTPPATPPIDPTPPPVSTDTGDSFDTGSSVTTSTGSGDIGSADTGGIDTPTDTSDDTAAPTDLGDQAVEETAVKIPKGWPGYVWLGILAGIVGLSMVRSVVLDRVAGIRPDGVLAQIRRVNASRRGAEAAAAIDPAASTGTFAAIAGSLKSLGERSAGIAGKLRFGKKGS
ncbi:MAG: hypothetical protein M3271_05170, partial [Actinomycetota bacterium]|nr:hypothetical protein [Actinomycetota bacterium]